MANDDFSELPRRADSKFPIFILRQILGQGRLRDPGGSLGRILGGPSIEPFGGGGGHLCDTSHPAAICPLFGQLNNPRLEPASLSPVGRSSGFGVCVPWDCLNAKATLHLETFVSCAVLDLLLLRVSMQ